LEDIINSQTGLLLVNADDRIIAYNGLAKVLLMEDQLLNKDFHSILSNRKIGFEVEQIEFSISNSDVEEAKYSHDEIFVTDSMGNTIYCNETFESNYGVKRSDIIGKKFWLLNDGDYLGECPIPEVINDKKNVTVVQQTKTGKKLVITATPVFDDNGDIEIIVENSRDITQLEQVKQDLEATKEVMAKYKKEVEELRRKELEVSNELILKSEKIKDLMKVIKRVAPVESSILILGESGTGKSVFAKYIHRISHFKGGPFITINCTTIPEHLLESELFGYAPGAFTGAKKEGKTGLVELADGGTLFLDEIGELPLTLQAKFLELIQERHFTPVGSVKPKNVNIRIISATNQNLSKLVVDKKFRESLMARKCTRTTTYHRTACCNNTRYLNRT